MKFKLCSVALALSLTVGVASAETSAKPAAPAPLKCSSQMSTGSHLSARSCVTQSDARRRAQADQEALSHMQNRPEHFSSAANR